MKKELKNKIGVDICFKYNEEKKTYKKLRFEKEDGNWILSLTEGEKGKGYNKISITLTIEDLLKLKWIIDKELEYKAQSYRL